MNIEETKMDRRDALKAVGTAATVVGGLAWAGSASAQHEHHMMHHGGGNDEIVQTATDCVAKGEACLAHCLKSFESGDTELAVCAARVNELIASCGLLARLAATESRHLKAMAAVSSAICTDCEAECRKHEVHPECKACGDACLNCIEACKALLD
jgi:Cys-rich four helix bundle protein (predicted Tat secretion target)